MPHVSDVRATSHDRHDLMLVAALAADDLAGADRDQAIAVTADCADCAILRDDLLALARATASVPPPIATRSRDFQLTPADAARLRPGGWRRLVAAFAGSGAALTRPLGAGLATLGIVGLLIGNVSVGVGGSAAASPAPAAAAAASDNRETTKSEFNAAPVPAAASAGAAAGAAPSEALAPLASAAASAAPAGTPATTTDMSGSGDTAVGPQAASSAAAGRTSAEDAAGQSLQSTGPVEPQGRPANLLFIAAIALGALLVGWSIAERRRET